MNTHVRPPDLPLTTKAAEGLERRRWSVAEVEAMAEAGFFEENERFELFGGEIVPMSPKGNRHELLKGSLTRYWAKRLRDEYVFITETTFRVRVDSFLEPDLIFYPAADTVTNLKPGNALLVVEISDSSLGYDLGRKASLYAELGIRELWVINAVTLEAHVHKNPQPAGYQSIAIISGIEALTAEFAPELAVVLNNLRLA